MWFAVNLMLLSFFATDDLINVAAQSPSRSFELRYFTPDPEANGETDFEGKTEYFNTEQRIEYLKTYEKVAGKFFENCNRDQLVVDDLEVSPRKRSPNFRGKNGGISKGEFTEDRNSRDIPFYMHTFLDENFSITPYLDGWQDASYEDDQWETVLLPHAHGGDRYKDESRYLRKTFFVSKFTLATLNFEFNMNQIRN